MESILFGDIFIHNENDYIFLGATQDIVYAIKILDVHQSDSVKNLDDVRARRPDAYKYNGNMAYCYVVLKTEDFIGRVAHFAHNQHGSDAFDFNGTGQQLIVEDIEAIKKEILGDDGRLPKGLKDIVAQLDTSLPCSNQ